VQFVLNLARSLPAIALAMLASCGGSHPKTDAPVAAASSQVPDELAPAPSASASSAPDPTPAMPTACASSGDECTFKSDFVDRLCSRQFLEASLVLWSSTTWTRGYLRANVDGWNASGGVSMPAKLAFDEEVIVLRHRVPPKNSIIVGDSGGYDVLRWDGFCYSLDASEVTLKKPPRPKRAHVPFFKIGKTMQDAILASAAVTKAYAKRMKECGGTTQGEVSLACEKADNALSAAVSDFIVSGAKLPEPAKLP
jgi:hypothetical protein